MAWGVYKVEQQRLEAILAYSSGLFSMTDVCKKYNISRKTAYKWYKRYLELGEDGLKDLSKAPLNTQNLYSQELIDRAISLKLEHKTWGPKKILSSLEEKYPDEDWPSATRLYEIFKSYHLVTSKRIKGRVPATAPLGHIQDCNDTWGVDLKGWFLTGNGYKCEPLTIMDCHSRYLIECTHLDRHTSHDVWPVFERAFLKYGTPLKIRSDNGPPFATTGAGRLSKLSVNLIKAGVTPEWIRPGHPEENGRQERMHLTLKQEVAMPAQETISLQVMALSQFQYNYNFKRHHEALGMKTPGSCYQKSFRNWDGILRSPEYDTQEMTIRKTGLNGCVWLNQVPYYVGEALSGEYIGLKLVKEDVFDLYFGPIYLGKLDKNGFKKPKLKTRRPR
jgi:putative transposase